MDELGNRQYYELDLSGNVRRLRGPAVAGVAPDLGGYRYTAFGSSITDATAPSAPTGANALPVRWKGRWLMYSAGSGAGLVELYDMRARWWWPQGGVFASADDFVYHNRSSTLWGWGWQNPLRWSDPSGRTTLEYDTGSGQLIVDPEQLGAPVYAVNVTSGVGQYINDPSASNMSNAGPIPAGSYTIDTDLISDPNMIQDTLRNVFGDWGDWRVRLSPDSGTDTFGRDGFFLHGGCSAGSLGCIDVGGGRYGDAVTDRLLHDLLSDPDHRVPLIVVPTPLSSSFDPSAGSSAYSCSASGDSTSEGLP